jgi:hypothetical protein
MGKNDRRHCLGGWWGLSRRKGEPVRWINQEAHVLLKAPEQAIVVGIEIYVPRRLRARRTWRLLVRDYWVGGDVGAYLDARFETEPGRWQRVEMALPAMPPARSDVEIVLAVDPPPGPWSRRLNHVWPERSIAVRRLWLGGARIEPKDVTICVLNWKRSEETIDCLESLAQADLRGASVLVIDNGSGDGSPERIRARFPQQEILCLPRNEGYAGGNNAGIRAALQRGAKAVLLLNNDTRVAADFLEPLLWTLNVHGKAAAVSSAIMRMDHPEILDVAYLEVYFGHGIVYQRGVNALPGQGFDVRKKVDVAVGCSVLMTAEAISHIGPLDEAYFAYHEEVDWCQRARAAGFEIYYDPYSRVYHGGSKSSEALATKVEGERTTESKRQLATPIALSWNPIRAYLGARNTVRFVRLHGNLRQRIYFWLSSLYAAPLEALAAILRQEPALKIGAFGYRRALSVILFGPEPEGAREIVRGLLRAPISLLWNFPREAWRAHREGRTAQVAALVRGLWDGIRERPLPLERLGLR